MHLTLLNILRSWFRGGYGEKSPKSIVNDDEHAYVRGKIKNRSPCPGLNALANQGYL